MLKKLAIRTRFSALRVLWLTLLPPNSKSWRCTFLSLSFWNLLGGVEWERFTKRASEDWIAWWP